MVVKKQKSFESHSRKSSGFTLIEIICVLAIIGAMVAMLMPMKTSALTKFDDTKLKTDLVTVDSALMIYKLEHNNLPEALSELEGSYLTNKEYKNISEKNFSYKKGENGKYELYCINSKGEQLYPNGEIKLDNKAEKESSN